METMETKKTSSRGTSPKQDIGNLARSKKAQGVQAADQPPPNLLHEAPFGWTWPRNIRMASWWPRCPPRVPASARPAGARIGPTPCRPPGVDPTASRVDRDAMRPGEGAAGHGLTKYTTVK